MINRFIVLILEIKILDNWRREHQILLEKIISLAGSSDDNKVQKKKFLLLTELFIKLCNSKNYRANFKNLSSLILLLLNFYKKNYPVDIFSKAKNRNTETEKEISDVKQKLKQELRNFNPKH